MRPIRAPSPGRSELGADVRLDGSGPTSVRLTRPTYRWSRRWPRGDRCPARVGPGVLRCGPRLRRGDVVCATGGAARVLRVRAIRRFTVRPVLPEVLKPLGDLARNLRWCWNSDTQDLFRSVDPDLWESSGHDPVKLLSDVSVERLETLSSDKRFLKTLRVVQADLADYTSGDLWYAGFAAENPSAPAGHRVLLPGVRHHRGAAAVLRRPRDPRRRPPQDGLRPRRPHHRRGPALPAGLLPPVAERRRLAAGDVPAARPERAAADAAARG